MYSQHSILRIYPLLWSRYHGLETGCLFCTLLTPFDNKLVYVPSMGVLFPDFAQGSFGYSTEDGEREGGEHSKRGAYVI